MYSEFWSNKSPQASGNAAEMLRELVRIGFEQAVARAEASARMARSLAGCRTPLDAISVYQDWMVSESQRVVGDMARMAELTRTMLHQSSEAAMLNVPVDPMQAAAGKPEPKAEKPAAKAPEPAQSAPAEPTAAKPEPAPEAATLPKAEPKPAGSAGPASSQAPESEDKAPKKAPRKKQATAAD